jgi:hypothetical protein
MGWVGVDQRAMDVRELAKRKSERVDRVFVRIIYEK